MTKTCKICHEEFEPQRANAQFCPKDHYGACKNCGEQYLIKKVVAPPEFCSGSCATKYRNKNQIVTKSCKLCGDEFQATNPNARFCGKDHKRTCPTCDKKYVINNPSRPTDYCSWECSVRGKTYEKICQRCGDKFSTNSPKIVYCSKDHYNPCEKCGKEILLKNPKRVTRYCSFSCAASDRSYENKCIVCGQKFITKKADAKYCDNPHQRNCEVCGKEFTFTYKPYASAHIAKTCSSECAVKLTDYEARNAKSIITLEEKYGVNNSYQIPHVIERMRKESGKRVSKLNFLWKDKLENELGVTFTLEKEFSKQKYADLNHGNLFIDINPTISHNSSYSFLHMIKKCRSDDCDHKPKEMDYHFNRALAAEASGKQLLQYFDWFDETIFLSIVCSKLHLDEHRVFAKNCEVKVISQTEANRFLKENHLLGAATKQTYCVGLYYEQELIHVNTYGPARLNKNYEWEAIRSCSKMNWKVTGAFSRCDKKFFKDKNPSSVISYVDLSLSTGATELANPGWELISTNRPTATWVFLGIDQENEKHPKFIKDLTAQKLSADRLLGLEIGKKYPLTDDEGNKITNDFVLLCEGYIKVYDAGTRTFGWRK